MNAITVNVSNIPPPVMAAHGKTLLDCIGDYFDKPENQAAFEAWHIQKYGHPPRKASYIK